MSYFDDASLVMIPSGYKTSKVYSVKPTSGDGDLTFTRSNDTATRVGPDGLIEKVRTNLVLQSQAFNTTGNWPTNASPTITANTTVAPDGTTTADTIAAAASFSGVYQSFGSISNGVEYSWSVYIKNISSASNIFLGVVSNPSTATLNFDATSGTIIGTGGSITSSSVTSVGNGWYRLSGTYISTGTSTDFAIYGMGTMSFAVWGAQLETGVTTAYIATTTAAVSVGPVANVPRLDYLNSSCPRLNLEPQRTNLTQYSEQLDNAYWNKSGGTITANSTASPDGYTNADLFTESATSGDHAFFDYVNYFVSGTTYTASFFVKSNGRTKITLTSANSDTCPRGQFDLVAQTATAVGSSFNAKIENYGNGWFRCSVSRVAPNTGLDLPYYAMNTSFSTNSYAGNGTSGMYFWGMQMEAGAYATSYIPTLGAAVTRGADACSKTGISSLIGQTEGTLFAEFDVTLGVDGGEYFLSDGTNVIAIQFPASSPNTIRAIIYNGGGFPVLMDYTYSTAGSYKVAYAYKANDFVLYVDGVQRASDTSGTVPACSIVQFSGAQNVASALVFKTRLSNADLAALTA